uniref:Large ribosomal subunit protein uL3m n=2 Tax=Macrostomum lignano TaxID=282301 RepID=A0A1I8FYZ9_9PLAT
VSAASAPALSSQLIVAMATAPHTWLRLVPSCRSYSKATRLHKIDYPWKDEPKPHWVRQFEARRVDADLTPENRDWLRQWRLQRVRDAVASSSEAAAAASPLKEPPAARPLWTPRVSQRCGLVGIKLGILPMWYRNGQKVHTTVVQIPDQRVLRWVPPEDLGNYASLREMRPYRLNQSLLPRWLTQQRWGLQLVGAVPADPANFTAQWCGIFKAAGLPPMRKISRFLVSPDAALQPGACLGLHHFRVGDCVDVVARTVNRGFQGVMERHLMEGGPAAHGSTKFHRKMGSAAGGGGPIYRGKRMPGVMGNRFRAARSLPVLRVNTKHRLLFIKGFTPGPPHSYCQIMDSWMLDVRRSLDANPPPMPTYFAEDAPEGGYPEDVYHPDLLPYDQPLELPD